MFMECMYFRYFIDPAKPPPKATINPQLTASETPFAVRQNYHPFNFAGMALRYPVSMCFQRALSEQCPCHCFTRFLYFYLQDSCARVLLFRGGNKELKNYNSQTPFQVRRALGSLQCPCESYSGSQLFLHAVCIAYTMRGWSLCIGCSLHQRLHPK